jgi:hypothetical protein
MPLILKKSITNFAEPIEEHSLCQRVPGLTLVQTGGDPPSQCWIFEPRQREKGSFDPSDLAQCESKAVARVRAKLAQDQRRGDGALFIIDAASRRTSPSCCSMIFVFMERLVMELNACHSQNAKD